MPAYAFVKTGQFCFGTGYRCLLTDEGKGMHSRFTASGATYWTETLSNVVGYVEIIFENKKKYWIPILLFSSERGIRTLDTAGMNRML